jgi:hypothetical protein
LAGELVGAEQNGACAGMNAIIDSLPKTIPNSYVISSTGCSGRPDHLHFTPAGYRELGRRYGEKMLTLLGYQIAPPAVATPKAAQLDGNAAKNPGAARLPLPILPALPDAKDTSFYADNNAPHGQVE